MWIDEEVGRVEWKTPDGTVRTLALEATILMLSSLDLAAPSNEEWFVGAIDASQVWHLYHVTDKDGDGFPDPASATLLFDTGSSKAFITDIVHSSEDSSIVFLLGCRCQDIYIATDTDSDGLPDDLATTPFARSADFPVLLHASMLHAAVDDAVTALDSPNAVPRRPRGRLEVDLSPQLRFEDTDEDRVADTGSRSQKSVHAQIRGRCRGGASELKVVGDVGETVQIWDVPASGPATLLGSKTMTSAGWDLSLDESWETLHLSRPLVAGETIRVSYASGSVTDYELKVKP